MERSEADAPVDASAAPPPSARADVIEAALGQLVTNLELLSRAVGAGSTAGGDVERLLADARREAQRVGSLLQTRAGLGAKALTDGDQGPLPSRRVRPLRLLVVDDEPAVAKAAVRIFHDCDVVAVGSATEAMARITAGDRFEVILSDLMMPKMTGMDLYEELVRVAPDQAERMVFITGGALTPRGHAFVASSPNPVVEKPFDPPKLRALVRDRAETLGLSDGVVLVVDDDPSALKLTVHWLTRAGFTCVARGAGQAALETVLQAPDRIEALVVDAMMPGMDGLELVARLRADPVTSAIPMILVTARELEDDDVVEGVDAGAVDYMTKPSSGALLVAKVRALCARYRAERELRTRLSFAEEHATTDALTGLMNRRAFDLRVVEMLATATRHEEPLALVMLDLDHFKQLNDEFGHLGGDRALLYFARTVRRVLRIGDYAFRYGGEEFSLILPKTTLDDALQVCARVRAALSAQPVALAPGRPATVRFSAGVAAAGPEDSGAPSLIERADAALYRAKRNGRDRAEPAA